MQRRTRDTTSPTAAVAATPEAATTAGLSGTLLRARTTVPRPSARTLSRRRLLDRLDLGVEGAVTVVCGSPGSGKTQLVLDWVASSSTRPTAWVALGEDCNEPQRLWSLVVTALQRVDRSSELLRSLRPPADVDSQFLDQLLVALADLRTPIVLVLEDVHELHAREALAGLDLLVGAQTGSVHVVLVTRSDPPLTLHRLRLAGELVEIRQAALGFTPEEAADLFAQHGLVLTAAELEQVMARTEGWAAGLRLAALALEEQPDTAARAAAVAHFAGDNRVVADYLMAEVLDAQPAWLRDFLLLTSVVERIDATLADELVGGTGGAAALDLLERSGALVVALDEPRGWYRYHRLFLEVCRHRLSVERPGDIRAVHVRAARWFAAHGEPVEAVRHALLAEDWQLVARTAVAHAGALVFGHAGRTTQALLRGLPDDAAPQDVWVACARTLAWYDDIGGAELGRRLEAAEALLDETDPQTRRTPELVLALVRAARSRASYDVKAATLHSTRALSLAEGVSPEEVPAIGGYVALAHALLGKSLVWQGLLPLAESHLRAARITDLPTPGLPDIDDTAVLATAYLALVMAMNGSLEAARVEAESALDLAARAGWADDAQTTAAHLALTLIHILQADHAAAEQSVTDAARVLAQKPDLLLEICRRVASVRLLALDGDHDAAAMALGETDAMVRTLPELGFLSGWIDILYAENDLAAGRYEELLSRVRDSDGLFGPMPTHARVVRARALLALGRADEALASVTPVITDDLPARQAVIAWLIVAEAQESLRHDGAALDAIGRALELAEPERLARPFLLTIDQVAPLLERHRATVGTSPDLVTRLLGMRTPQPVALTDPLTDRELAVLQLLPSMMSNAEIADELFVSVNTVKAHLKSLYRKLGAVSRRDAVVRSGLQLTASGRPRPDESAGGR